MMASADGNAGLEQLVLEIQRSCRLRPGDQPGYPKNTIKSFVGHSSMGLLCPPALCTLQDYSPLIQGLTHTKPLTGNFLDTGSGCAMLDLDLGLWELNGPMSRGKGRGRTPPQIMDADVKQLKSLSAGKS
eukprot:Skav206905  [mRNA]  locus=scaffold808:161336:161725:- [translate_table: standard]